MEDGAGVLKKIVFASQNLNPGGAERVMCTVLRAMDPNTFETHLILVSGAGPLSFLIPKHVRTLALGIANTRKAFFSFVRAMRRIRPDVVYAPSSRIAILVLAARLFSPKYKVVARYSSMPAHAIQKGNLCGWRLYLTRFIYRFADAVIAQTEEMADELTFYFRIQKQRIHCIPNPIDVTYIEECLADAVSPFDNESINVVAVGRLHPLKGFDVLIEAIALARAEEPRLSLHILGGDHEGNRTRLEQRAEALGVKDRVHFHGFTENPYPYYKFCDLFVLSSRYEAMPNVLLESLFLGKPVVVTRCVPVVERLVLEGINGFKVDVDNVQQMSRAILGYRQLQGETVMVTNDRIVRLIEEMVSIPDK